MSDERTTAGPRSIRIVMNGGTNLPRRDLRRCPEPCPECEREARDHHALRYAARSGGGRED